MNTVDAGPIYILHQDSALNRSEFLFLAGPGRWTRFELHVDYLRLATAVLGAEVEDAAAAALAAARDNPDHLEQAHFFVSPDAVTEARGMQTRAEESSQADRPEAGLEEQVEALRRRAANDSTVRPDLAARLVDVAPV